MANALELITAISDAVNPMAIMQRITDRTLELIEPAHGVMIGLADSGGVTYVTGAGNQVALAGTYVEIGSSLTGVALRTREVQRSDDTELDPRADVEACRRHSVRSLVCVPLVRGEEAIGVMAVNAPIPGAFDDHHVEVLRRLAQFVGVAITSARDLHDVSSELVELALNAAAAGRSAEFPPGADDEASRYVMGVLDPAGASRLASNVRIQALLDAPDQVRMVFQPVVDLLTDEPIAVEALARFAPEPYRSPELWIEEAHQCGLGIELELLAVERAFDHLAQLPADLAMTVNIGPDAVRDPRFASLVDGLDGRRVVLELTEHAEVDDYTELIGTLRALRDDGLRVAIDDTGAGYSSLAHILRIAPDFIKLDRELTHGIDGDPVRRALAAALVSFAADTGADIVAEGVETADELDVLRGLGVRYGQGYHLGRPAPLGSTADQ